MFIKQDLCLYLLRYQNSSLRVQMRSCLCGRELCIQRCYYSCLDCKAWSLSYCRLQLETFWLFSSDLWHQWGRCLFLEPFYINPRDHCLGKSKQNISFWNTQTTLSGTNDHVNVTSVRFLPWSEAQTLSTCLNVSCCHVIGWWDIYINGQLNRCL